MMRVVVLGSGTCVPRAPRGPAGYALAAGESLVLLDSGSGTLGRLARSGLDYRRLTHAFYTHVHPDHTADLGPLLFALNYTPDFERTAALRMVGPPGFSDFLAALERAWPWIRPRGEWLELREAAREEIDYGEFVLRVAPVEHAGLAANAYRLDSAAGSVVFSGDTEYCRSLVELARGADLLVIEASAPHREDEPGAHLTAAEAGRVAAEAGARSVVLTHLYPRCDEHDMVSLCAATYDGPITVAEDLAVYELP